MMDDLFREKGMWLTKRVEVTNYNERWALICESDAGKLHRAWEPIAREFPGSLCFCCVRVSDKNCTEGRIINE